MAEDLEQLLGSVVERKGRLLRTTLDGGPGGWAKLALTFDVGTISIQASGGALMAQAHPAAEGEAGTNADELDPWWTVLGNPLCRVSEHEDGLLIQFREDAESPRIFLLRAEGPAVQVRTIA